MSTETSELLYWHHIENQDYAGAEKHAQQTTARKLAPAEVLKIAAREYLDGAIEDGTVTASRIFQERGRTFGYTQVETDSGVGITKYSDGSYALTAEYDEPIQGETTERNDLTVKIGLPVASRPTVYEERQRVSDDGATGEGGEKTLGRRDAERAMGQVTKLITQIF